MCSPLFLAFFLLIFLTKFAGTQIPIGTVIVAQQQRETTPILPISNGNGGANELVDQIESIDVSATQLIITTSRQGPPDMARVAIQVMDIVSGEELPHQNLTGILLVLTRGRYTVNWLRPNRWYGVLFRAEQHYSGGSAVYANEEAHLVKTHRADGSNEDNKPILSVRAQRYGDGGRSLENLVLTIRWEQHPDERTNLDAVANVTLFCSDQIKYRQLRLRGSEIDKSVEIRLDNHFEVNEQKNGSARQMVASIRPKNCPRICWNAELIAEMSRGRTFRRAAAHNCEEIEPISAIAILRNYLGYKLAPNNDLIIFTDYIEPRGNETSSESSTEADGHSVNENDAYVQLTAIVVPEPKKADNLTIRYKTFNTNKHGEEFVLDKLEKGRIYAVQYSYGKQSPFAYEESRRFLVDTGSSIQPFHLEFNFTGENSLQPGVLAIARLDPAFKQYEMGVDLEPLCEKSEATIHFWLDKDRKMRELRELRVLDALCTASPGHSVCRVPGTAAATKGCAMREGKLCWTTNIVVHEKLFSAERKCESLANAIPQLMATTAASSTKMMGNGQQNAHLNNSSGGGNSSSMPGASKNNANCPLINSFLIPIFSFIFIPIFHFVIFH